MSDEKKLTVNDPVDPETIRRIGDLTGARYDVADKLLSLEQQKVALLVTAKQIDDEKKRLFAKILIDRGLSPETAVELDAETGAITVHPPQKP